jgi:hypothetical protein
MSVPLILYKYGSAKDLQYYLQDRTLLINHVRKFQDPFEFKPWFKHATYKAVTHRATQEGKRGPKLKRGARGWTAMKEENLRAVEAEHERTLDRIGVACFSSIHDHLLMWAHYAQNHKGLCFGFDTTVTNLQFRPVKYHTQRPCYCGTKALMNVDVRKTAEAVALTKSTHWKYEKEYRLIVHWSGEPFPQTLKFPPHLLQSVVFGVRCEQKTKDAAFKLAADDEFCGLTFYQATFHPKKFALQFEEVRNPLVRA